MIQPGRPLASVPVIPSSEATLTAVQPSGVHPSSDLAWLQNPPLLSVAGAEHTQNPMMQAAVGTATTPPRIPPHLRVNLGPVLAPKSKYIAVPAVIPKPQRQLEYPNVVKPLDSSPGTRVLENKTVSFENQQAAKKMVGIV